MQDWRHTHLGFFVHLGCVAGSDWCGASDASSAQDSDSIKVTRSGSQQPSKGPAEHFTGSVQIEPLFPAHQPSRASGGKVTFEPGARSAWHTHPLGQTLIVTNGTGWIQQWGGPIKEIRKGDVICVFSPGAVNNGTALHQIQR